MSFENATQDPSSFRSEREAQCGCHEPEMHSTTPPIESLSDFYLPGTAVKAIIRKSRDGEALAEYMTAYHSAIPPKKPLRCKLDYFESSKACEEMGFEMFVTLNLNRVACALGMGFFSLGSAADHEDLATKWAFDKEFAAAISTIGITLLYRYINPRGRPNPLGSQRSDVRAMQPNLFLRWALEHYPGLTAEDTQTENLKRAVPSEDVEYKRFTLDGDEATQVTTLERLERDFQCEDYAHVIKLLHFWS